MEIFIYLYLVNSTPVLGAILWFRSRTSRGAKLASKLVTTLLVLATVFLVHGVIVATETWATTLGAAVLNFVLWYLVLFNTKGKTDSAPMADGKPSNELIVLSRLILNDDKVDRVEAEQLLELLNCTHPKSMDPVTRTLFQAVDHAISNNAFDAVAADEIRVLLGELCDLDLQRKVDYPVARKEPKKSTNKDKAKAKKSTQEAAGLVRKAERAKPIRNKITKLVTGSILQFDYMDAAGNVSQRQVDFRASKRRGGNIYLAGWDLSREAVRTFRADRISNLVDCSTGEVISDAYQSLKASSSV